MSPAETQPGWTEANFEFMSWHDCTIHSMGLEQDEANQSDIVLDLDFLIEWIPASSGAYRFRIAPALLRFHGADKLAIHMLLDYKQAMQISEITRCRSNDPNFVSFHWMIKLHSYFGRESYIEFDAPAFSQLLTAEPIETNRQNLSVAERLKMKCEGRSLRP